MSDEKRSLPFHNLAERHLGVTPALGEAYTEAACVCLDRHHVSPVDFEVSNNSDKVLARAEWERTDERLRAAWGNEIDATEAAAYACVLAAVELMIGMVAIRRAETKTGADYYIALPSNGMEDLEACYRLEVSGVDRGSASTVQQRLRAKLEQAALGACNLPAIAGVIGFRARLLLLQYLERR